MYLSSGLLIVVLLLLLRRVELSRVQKKNERSLADLADKSLVELNKSKNDILEYLSHEFRTPLTLIKGPIELLMENSTDSYQKHTLQGITTNVAELLQLIDQIHELSALEPDTYPFKVSRGDIIALVRGLHMSFASMAGQNKVKLKFEVSAELEMAMQNENLYYNAAIIQKVINVIIQNGINNTKQEGTFRSSVSLNNDGDDFIHLSFQDEGMGMDQEHVLHLFDSYYFYKAGQKQEGIETSGIKMAYIYQLMKVHKGKIDVKSVLGKGNCFTISLPLGDSLYAAEEILLESSPLADHRGITPKPLLLNNLPVNIDTEVHDEEKPWALIIDDQMEIRKLVSLCLKKEFRLLLASDGASGYSMAKEYIPDLIISDLMMPLMDGIRLCEKIKTNDITSHIPLIMLTAKSGQGDKLESLQIGADDYLLKPFDGKELTARAMNLVENRKVLRQKFSSNNILSPGEIIVNSQDKLFVEKILALIDQHIANSSFSVDELSKCAGMSHSQLHRKLKAILNMSGSQLVRSVRMHRAMELLQKNVGNISEISFLVGYEDPGYFTKTFYKFFGKLPSEIQVKST